ncbi:efflux RND transporter periplasmic adaptor subunit [Mesoterricola silvestris]|nr:efflux RND transporter periplasmic adaptor subunit [Mesoterricola silvestris]
MVSALAIMGIILTQRRALAGQAEARRRALEAGPLVNSLVMGEGATLGDPMVQGEALPFLSTTLYARASGFVKEIRVDKGSVVRKGQLLAVIEGREMDQDLAALKADAENKTRNAERATDLLKDKLISAKDAEQAQADARMAESRLSSLGISRDYQAVRAPFDGVVTQRFVDPGAMVQNASASTNVQPLVTVAQVDRLRVTFYLDQNLAKRVKTGDPVRILPDQNPAQAQPGRIARLAGALDPRTRTLTAEVDLDNRQGLFLPGGAVLVLLGEPVQAGFTLPLEAVAPRQGKPTALVVDGTSHTHVRPLMLGEDNGQRVRVLKGLQTGERVVLNPPPGLGDGSLVRLAGPGK